MERSVGEIEAQAYTTAARLERKVALLEKECTMLKGIVASYDAEEANFAGMAKFMVLPAQPYDVYMAKEVAVPGILSSCMRLVCMLMQ